jgi:DNA (cytosine-5)-methyltransferase 1
MDKLRQLSLFSGMGAFEKALENLKVSHEVVNYCEWERSPAKAFSILHNVPLEKNLGDITKVHEKELPDFDLMTWGFPCQDISQANVGGKGLDGERSGLYKEGLRILTEKRPKYSIIENVDNLVGKKHIDSFNMILKDLEERGYTNYWKVLNAVDYGVPQGRKRVLIVSIRNDLNQEFSFPELSIEKTKWWEYIDLNDTRNLTGRQQRAIDTVNGLNDDELNIEGTPQFDCAVITLRKSGLRFQANDEHPTIMAAYGKGGGNFTMLAYNGKITGITPRNCFKLMGFEYEDCEKLQQSGISVSDLYVMAGNSIVVKVLEPVLHNLLKDNYINN